MSDYEDPKGKGPSHARYPSHGSLAKNQRRVGNQRMPTNSGMLPPQKTAPSPVVMRKADGSVAPPLPFTAIPADMAAWAFQPHLPMAAPGAPVQARGGDMDGPSVHEAAAEGMSVVAGQSAVELLAAGPTGGGSASIGDIGTEVTQAKPATSAVQRQADTAEQAKANTGYTQTVAEQDGLSPRARTLLQRLISGERGAPPRLHLDTGDFELSDAESLPGPTPLEVARLLFSGAALGEAPLLGDDADELAGSEYDSADDAELVAELKRTEAEIAAAEKELMILAADTAIDLAGIADPTPISDGIAMARDLSRGDYFGTHQTVRARWLVAQTLEEAQS